MHYYSKCVCSDYCASRAYKYHIDGTNIARYANDGRNSTFSNNSRMEWMEDDTGFAWPFLIATRDIKKNEEILFDYGYHYWSKRDS